MATFIHMMQWRPHKGIPIAATNGKEVIYNPYIIAKMPQFEVLALVAHEYGHPALGHPWRAKLSKLTDHRTANIAGDFALNYVLGMAGYKIPDTWIHVPKYDNMSMEQIYKELKQAEEISGSPSAPVQNMIDATSSHNNQQQTTNPDQSANNNQNAGTAQPGNDSSAANDSSTNNTEKSQQPTNDQGQDPFDTSDQQLPQYTDWGDFIPSSEMDKHDQKEIQQEWREAADIAIDMINQFGDGIGQAYAYKLKEVIYQEWKEKLEPTIWDFVRALANSVAKNDYRWLPPNKKYVHQGIYLPSLISDQIDDMVIAVDVSGSIDEEQFNLFVDYINGILGEFAINLHLIQCSNHIVDITEYTNEDFPFRPTVRGGGGTKFSPVFEYILNKGLNPSGLIYFTDLEVNRHDLPFENPGYPILWAWNDDRETPYCNPPYGRIVRVE